MTALKLREHDVIITAWAESCSGPGWSNTVVWLLVKSRLDGALRIEALQPNEHTPEIHAVFACNEVAVRCLTAAVRSKLKCYERG